MNTHGEDTILEILQSAVLTIFGGTGDLAYRKLYPALYSLYKKDQLKEDFAVIGTARREWDDAYLREVVIDSIGDAKISDEHVEKFASHFYYQSHNVNDVENYDTLNELIDKLENKYQTCGNRIFYLSVSPSLFGTIARNLKLQHLENERGFTRLVIEKPFGNDYESSKKLNDEIMEHFEEEQIYRVDHYLEKDWIQAIIPFRFSNPVIESLWNHNMIDFINIKVNETLGIGERGVYFDETGALRDMFQNHILQLISLLLMKRPSVLSSSAISEAKVEALQQLQTYTVENIDNHFIRGQYKAGSNNKDAVDYRQEPNVSANSMTETYVAGKLLSNDNNWSGVPVYFTTGKYLTKKVTHVDIHFKEDKDSIFDEQTANKLSILIDPEQTIELVLNGKKAEYTLDPAPLSFQPTEPSKSAGDYEKLMYHVFSGNRTHFVHWNELEVSWKFVDHILENWEKADSPLHFYEVNTTGPEATNELFN